MKVREGKSTPEGGVLDEKTGRPVSYTRHITISRRDTFLNDLKNSTAQGILAFLLSLLAIPCLFYAIYVSYANGGQADYSIGIFAVLILCICIVSIVVAAAGLKNRKKIRHDLERRAIILDIILILLLITVYVYGLIRLLRG